MAFRIIPKGCFGNLKLVKEVEFKCYINITAIVCSVKADLKTWGVKDLCLDVTEENTYVMSNEKIYNTTI